MHTSGYYKEYIIDMLADGAGPKGAAVMTRTHAIGSAVTYGKRQLLKMIFNLAEAGDDDDGNAASAPALLGEHELEVIKAALEDAQANSDDIEQLYVVMKVKSLEQLSRSEFKIAMNHIAEFKSWKLKDEK